MKKITSQQLITITIKDMENDELTDREYYFVNEMMNLNVHESDIFGESNKVIASYVCTHYAYDNYTIITDNPVILTLMVESKLISADNSVFENLAGIPQRKIDDFKKIAY